MTALRGVCVTEEVLKGRLIIGLYPATQDETHADFRSLARFEPPMDDERRPRLYRGRVGCPQPEHVDGASIHPTPATSWASIRGPAPRMRERAMKGARDAFSAWSRSSPQLRHDILERIGDGCWRARTRSARVL